MDAWTPIPPPPVHVEAVGISASAAGDAVRVDDQGAIIVVSVAPAPIWTELPPPRRQEP